MKTTNVSCVAAMLLLLANAALAAELSLESAPPVVVRTVPVAGVSDVDPALGEIRVTFSKPMQDGSWSWSKWGEENFPEMKGQPRYLADNRTAVLPIGDHFTMGPEEASVAAELVGAARVVPSHYGTFPLLTGTPDALRPLLPPGIELLVSGPGETIVL